MDVRRMTTADEALAVAGDALREAGAEGELTLGLLGRLTVEPDAWGKELTLVAGEAGGSPAALVMMTGPYPVLIVGFGEEAAIDHGALVEAMDRRPTSVNGAVRWSEPFAGAWAEAGARVSLRRKMRAFELRKVRPPRTPAGSFRVAAPADAPVLEAWTVAFGDDIDEEITGEWAQATVSRLTAEGDLWLWERDGEPVSMAAVNRRTPWSSNVALVYTPPQERGRGYASAVVAGLSQRELDAGKEWCALFTDLANPTSNHIYSEIGYEPRCDFHHFALDW